MFGDDALTLWLDLMDCMDLVDPMDSVNSGMPLPDWGGRQI